ncbi:MAG: alpha-amylase family glycosyl hydrolase [Myxococcales bacterium]
MSELSARLPRPATLDDLGDAELDLVAEKGFDWVWLLSVWSTGPAGQRVSRTRSDWRREFEHTLPDLRDEDIGGSGFAITAYTVHPALGGDAALARVRERLRARGLRLMLDFVPNHTALDHPWIESHPEYYVAGTELDLARAPESYTWAGNVLRAHGRDPYFPAWPDTLQLDYSNPATQEAMAAELLRVAGQCDGVRCDMAMLLLPEVFERTWGRKAEPFWPAAIARVRERFPGFLFLAEVYWDLEWALLSQGFDYAYDKRLYDRLREGNARRIREHLTAGLEFQDKLARFLENHDEKRAAAAFEPAAHDAAAIVTFLSPGMRFFHQGQLEGRRKRVSPHLVRAPAEPADRSRQEFYARLLQILRRPAVRDGDWALLECAPAWEGNPTCDDFLVWSWQARDGQRLLVAVNYSDHRSQCLLRLPFAAIRLAEVMGGASLDVGATGLSLDLPAWGYRVFETVV